MENNDTELKNNQDSKKSWGGARPGGGRPKGSKSKLVITDFFTPEDINRLVDELRIQIYEAKDKDMIKFAVEQLFGKATQRNEHTGADGEQLVFAIAEAIITKNNVTNTEAERDSEG